jgi:hypothetical protein
MEMVGKHTTIAAISKRMRRPCLFKRVPQSFGMLDEQLSVSFEKIDGIEQTPTGDEGAAIIRHDMRLQQGGGLRFAYPPHLLRLKNGDQAWCPKHGDVM